MQTQYKIATTVTRPRAAARRTACARSRISGRGTWACQTNVWASHPWSWCPAVHHLCRDGQELTYRWNDWKDVQCSNKWGKARYFKHGMIQAIIIQKIQPPDWPKWRCTFMTSFLAICLTKCYFRWSDKRLSICHFLINSIYFYVLI